MQEFHEEEQRLWIIPGEGLEEKGLIDGEPIFYEGGIGNRDHRLLAADFCEKYNLDESLCSTHEGFGRYFTTLGMIVLINNGRIDGKTSAGLYLPSKLTEKQIGFFMNKRELFQEKFHEKIGLFEPYFWPEGELDYRTNTGFRDLKIESIIERRSSDNGQELFFRELEKQKEALKEHENKI